MNLFDQDERRNLLPYDGEVIYYGRILTPAVANAYLDELTRSVNWKNDEMVIYGKHFITQRKAAWYGDQNYSYTYSGTTKQASLWTAELREIKTLVEKHCGSIFNSCLLNLYHNGGEGMSWHSDDERSLGNDIVIASLSFGAERKFSFKHKTTKQTTSIDLENGSLLVMKGTTQRNWLHSVPKTTKIKQPRINLTFRTIVS